jgi:hypothetical protein
MEFFEVIIETATETYSRVIEADLSEVYISEIESCLDAEHIPYTVYVRTIDPPKYVYIYNVNFENGKSITHVSV